MMRHTMKSEVIFVRRMPYSNRGFIVHTPRLPYTVNVLLSTTIFSHIFFFFLFSIWIFHSDSFLTWCDVDSAIRLLVGKFMLVFFCERICFVSPISNGRADQMCQENESDAFISRSIYLPIAFSISSLYAAMTVNDSILTQWIIIKCSFFTFTFRGIGHVTIVVVTKTFK